MSLVLGMVAQLRHVNILFGWLFPPDVTCKCVGPSLPNTPVLILGITICFFSKMLCLAAKLETTIPFWKLCCSYFVLKSIIFVASVDNQDCNNDRIEKHCKFCIISLAN
ncbi:MAG: hypothetical protein ACRDL7_03720 [Gaiellaceae bacterium]